MTDINRTQKQNEHDARQAMEARQAEERRLFERQSAHFNEALKDQGKQGSFLERLRRGK